jgi:hypothetical protein
MKRVSYFHEDKNTGEIPIEDIKVEELFDIDDILDNEKTREILLNNHYFNFLFDLEDDIQDCYIYFKNCNVCEHFLNNDEFDFDGSHFMDIIYKYIRKDYKIDLFYDNLELAYPLFEKKDENVQKKQVIKQNQVVNILKKFDWDTKTYK